MKNIDRLRIFFRISTAAFEFAAKISDSFGIPHAESKMEALHKTALAEVEKDNPNLKILDKLLEEMQNLAKENYSNQKK